MKKCRKLIFPFVLLLISGFILVLSSSLRGEELAEPITPTHNPNIKIQIKEDVNPIEPGKNYTITWTIEGLKEDEQISHTDLHWAYLADLNTPEEINDYKNYPNKGRESTCNLSEYTDNIYLPPYDAKPPAIMLVIHVVINSQDYVLAPIPVDIVRKDEGQE